MISGSDIKKGFNILIEDGAHELTNKLKNRYSNPFYSAEDKVLGYYYNKKRGTDRNQKDLIHKLIEQEEFVLVILDACRFDYFQETYKDYLDGELKKVWSEGSRTPEWIPKTWTEDYNITYVSGAPYMSDFRKDSLSGNYTPSEHFERIKHVWATDWDGKRYTTNPSAITNTALSQISSDKKTRLVIHYLQPHQPYIGNASDEFREKPEIPIWDASQTSYSLEEIYKLNDPQTRHTEQPDLPRYLVGEQIRDGNLTVEEWRAAYKRNLRAIFNEEIKTLVKYINPECTTVISSDHGELLGERSEIFNRRLNMHPSRVDPRLKEVPWFTVNKEHLEGKQIPDSKIYNQNAEKSDISSTDVEEHLADLGYLE
ncbi:hypothetical protein [Halorubrum sp. LN27]|uniref:hypothetical protein n=1 Tax=Halorubrum sp. LN27 TaxID=2801032 RepID=UPI00190E0631|nr:hypothetical protein [Halorubrum sp. LN27]